MRGRPLTLLAGLVAVAVSGWIAAASPGAGHAPRASAQATVATGAAGTHGAVSVSGDGERSTSTGVSGSALSATGEATASARRAGSRGRASARVVASSVSAFDGLVTASTVRREATARSGTSSVSGTVTGLVVDGRSVGTVTGPASYDMDGKGTATVNSGGTGLTVTLSQPYAGHPAGSSVSVAIVSASAQDGRPAPEPPRRQPERRREESPAAERPDADGTDSRDGADDAADDGDEARDTSRPARRRPAPKVTPKLTEQKYAFPVYEPLGFDDTFGASRQIGAHQGNDIYARFGAPVLAVADGRVEKVGTLAISGNRLWLRAKGGDEFFYAHLSAFAPAAVSGRFVRAGTVLGFVGNTGDAEKTPPHLHFEIHPGGGDAVDPNPFLRAWSGARDVPPGAWLARYGADTGERPGALVEVRDYIAGD